MDNKKSLHWNIRGSWKQRSYIHKHLFTNPKLTHETVRPKKKKKIGELKDKNLNRQIVWKLKGSAQSTNRFRGRYSLYLEEKIKIIKYNDASLLTQRKELVFKCQQRNKFKLP